MSQASLSGIKALLGAVAITALVASTGSAQTVSGNRVRLTVRVPANATVTIDGATTNQTGASRQYISPPLDPAKKYLYTLVVTWSENGRPQSITRKVSVRAGQEINLNLTAFAKSGPTPKVNRPNPKVNKPIPRGLNSLRLQGPLNQEIELPEGTDFRVAAGSGKGPGTGQLVFLGYGATAKGIPYDDYAGVDVKGKVIIVLQRTPRWGNAEARFDGDNYKKHAAISKKVALAESHGAAAVLLVNDRSQPDGMAAIPALKTSAGIPIFQVRRSVVDAILRSSNDTTLKMTEADIDRNLKPQSMVIKGWSAAAKAR